MRFSLRSQMFALLMLAWGLAVAQTTFSVRVNNAGDDMEEYIAGPGQTKPLGSFDPGSSDLELGAESANNVDPQLVGMRFNNVSVPKGALILGARIRFTVDATAKNTDPCNLIVKAQAADNPATFNTAVPFDISSRPTLSDSALWAVPAGSWTAAGQSGPAQTTPDLKALVQALVNRDGWAAGNSMVFTVRGTGLREAESFDGSPSQAPELEIVYIQTQTASSQVAAAEDDIEEYIAGPGQTKPIGSYDPGSSDLELGAESANNVDPQLVGMRFNNVVLPAGAVITRAYIQFQVDAIAKNTDPCNLIVKAQADPNPGTFVLTNPGNVSSRPTLADSVLWTVPAGSWTAAGQAGPDQRTPDLKALVQALVNQTGWASGNSMVFTVRGTGLREAESFDGSPSGAPKLVIEYVPVASASSQVAAAEDDIEEYIAGPGQTKPIGSYDPGSSDLELGAESANNVDPQLVGMRFNNVVLPAGAMINRAYIQFQVDAIAKNTDPCNLIVKAQADPNPGTFVLTNPGNVSSRPTLADSVLWTVPAGSWGTVGAAGADQRTPDLKALVQALVNQAGWASGNSMVFTVRGTGLREAESFDGSPSGAPKLVIEYLADSEPTGNPTTAYPVESGASWSYYDRGDYPGASWTSLNFNDTTWAFGPAVLGYGDSDVATTVDFGGNTSNRHITTYFRKRFEIANVSSLTPQVELRLRADDGAVVYLNGSEVARLNMPSGAVDSSTLAAAEARGDAEQAYFVFDVPAASFQSGENIVAVEVHQVAASSDDKIFDLELVNRTMASNAPALGCSGPNDLHISCFTSLLPGDQKDTLSLPPSHAFQYIFRANDPYNGTSGNALTNFDFTGYVPINGSSREGYLSINHETAPGGVSILELDFDNASGEWTVDSSFGVSFTPVVLTAANCSGDVTPWSTVITCEEVDASYSTDADNDGYIDLGWCVEIDPVTKKVRDYGTGKPQKLWALGRMSHENVKVMPDKKTVYFGEDDGTGNVYKFVADVAENLTAGTLYVLKLDQPTLNGEPQSPNGQWVIVPNSTQVQRNTTKALAAGLGATPFAGVEDVDVSPIDGKIYFAVKGVGRVYRFTDNGTTVSGFETFVGGPGEYRISSEAGVISEAWNQGNDNLTFDDRGNLWVLQDGGRNHVWMVRPDHTQASPRVELFFETPFGAEPTGMTFTPDYRYMFVSIQEPSSSNATNQADATGTAFRFNRSTALVIAREQFLGQPQAISIDEEIGKRLNVHVYPNPFSDAINLQISSETGGALEVEVSDPQGRRVLSYQQPYLFAGEHLVTLPAAAVGMARGVYICRISVGNATRIEKIVRN